MKWSSTDHPGEIQHLNHSCLGNLDELKGEGAGSKARVHNKNYHWII